jgi:hypothetical protein
MWKKILCTCTTIAKRVLRVRELETALALEEIRWRDED